MAEEKSSVSKKTPNKTKGGNAKNEGLMKEVEILAKNKIANSIVNQMTGFFKTFSKTQNKISELSAKNITRSREDLMSAFSGVMKEGDLLPNLLSFKDYLDQTGETVEQFGKTANLSEDTLGSLKQAMTAFDKSVKEMDKKERNLKKAGLVVEQEIVNNKLRLKVLNGREIRDKQRDIINKREEIKDEEKLLSKLTRTKDEQGRVSEETQKQIEVTSQTIEQLNQEILDIKDKGVKEVKKVLNGFAGAIVDSYTTAKDKVTKFTDAFLPGPVNQVFSSLIQAVEGIVTQVVDLFKPLTATFKLIAGAPRYIAKKIFKKTDEEFEEMRGNFIKKTKKFLTDQARMAHEGVTKVGMYLGGKFLQAVRFVGKVFTAIGLAVKGILLALMPFKLKILLIVGLLALVGVGIFLFSKKLVELGKFVIEKVKPVFQKIADVMEPIVKAIAGAFNKLIEAVKAVYNFFNRKATDESRQKKKEEGVDDGNVGKVKQQSKNQIIDAILKTEEGKKKYKRKNRMRQFDLEKLRQIGEEVGVDSKILERAKSDQALISSVESEKDLMKQKVKFSEQTTDDFIGLGKERSFGNIMKILSKNDKGANDLRERLKNNKQFQDLQRQKAEFDAQQAAMTGGQGATSNVASNITQNQNAGVYGKAPTRNGYAPYVDVNAMSYQ